MGKSIGNDNLGLEIQKAVSGYKKSNSFNQKKKTKSKKNVGIELLERCKKGDIYDIRRLVEAGRDLSIYNSNRNTALHISVLKGHDDVVKLLFEQNDLNREARNEDGETALFLACRNENDTILEFLFDNGMNIYQKNIIGEFCFELELSEYAESIFFRQEKNSGDFFEALSNRDLGKMKKIVDVGLNLHCTNKDKLNGLQVAIRMDRCLNIVEYLCKLKLEKRKSGVLRINKSVDFDKCRKEYKTLLKRTYYQTQLHNVMIEMLQTEKTYLDDLYICKELFPEKCVIYDVLEEHKNDDDDSEDDDEITPENDYPKKVLFDLLIGLTKELERVFTNNYIFVLKLMQYFKDDNRKNYSDILSLFKTDFNFDIYISYVPKTTILDNILLDDKAESDLVEFFKMLEDYEKMIPSPKIKKFSFLLQRPRDRLIKYKNLFCSMKKNLSKSDHSKNEIKEKVDELLEYIDRDILHKINRKIGIINDQKQLENLLRKINDFSNVEVSTAQKNDRKFVQVNKNLSYYDLNKKAFYPEGSLAIYFVSDMIVLETLPALGEKPVLKVILFNDHEIFFDFSEKHFHFKSTRKSKNSNNSSSRVADVDVIAFCSYTKKLYEMFASPKTNFKIDRSSSIINSSLGLGLSPINSEVSAKKFSQNEISLLSDIEEVPKGKENNSIIKKIKQLRFVDDINLTQETIVEEEEQVQKENYEGWINDQKCLITLEKESLVVDYDKTNIGYKEIDSFQRKKTNNYTRYYIGNGKKIREICLYERTNEFEEKFLKIMKNT